SWTPVTTNGEPTSSEKLAAVWTGSRMIVWGGDDDELTWNGSPNFPQYTFYQSGGAYDPVADAWAVGFTTSSGAPSARAAHTAIWTGSKMIVWGGDSSPVFNRVQLANTGRVYQ